MTEPTTWRRRTAKQYGTATTDPLGRDGPGWHKSELTRLPVRDKKTQPVCTTCLGRGVQGIGPCPTCTPHQELPYGLHWVHS